LVKPSKKNQGVKFMNVSAMSKQDKIGEAMKRSLPELPAEAQEVVKSLLSPLNLAIVAGTLVLWAGSHFFGVGELVDVILLAVGFLTIGIGIFSGAHELYAFATTAIDAKTEDDLNRAAKHFAKAVSILGITTIAAVLLKTSVKNVSTRIKTNVANGQTPFRIQPRINAGPAPAAGFKPTTTAVDSLPNGWRGMTDSWGNIQILRNQTVSQLKETLYHELVHRWFVPKLGPFRQIRADIAQSGYQKSAILRALEEALAEGVSQLRINGFGSAIKAWRFPLDGGYVTVAQLYSEGNVIGTITLGGTVFTVSISKGRMP
jgi:hypothetical protein